MSKMPHMAEPPCSKLSKLGQEDGFGDKVIGRDGENRIKFGGVGTQRKGTVKASFEEGSTFDNGSGVGISSTGKSHIPMTGAPSSHEPGSEN